MSNDNAIRFFNKDLQGFESGRTFRTFKEINIADAGVYTIRITTPIPVLFKGANLSITSGAVRLETIAGGAPAGTYSEALPRIKLNLTAITPYTPKVVLEAGGTVTDGTVIDVTQLKTDSNNNRSSSLLTQEDEVRGVAPGVYYWRFTATGAVIGIFKAVWEEL